MTATLYAFKPRPPSAWQQSRADAWPYDPRTRTYDPAPAANEPERTPWPKAVRMILAICGTLWAVLAFAVWGWVQVFEALAEQVR